MLVSLSNGRKLKFTFCYSSHDLQAPAEVTTLRQKLDERAALMNRRLAYAELAEVYPTQADGDSGSNIVTLAEGISVTHPKDTFSRSAGRKRAVAKALMAAFPSPTVQKSLTVEEIMANYDVRTQVWDQYKAEFGVN